MPEGSPARRNRAHPNHARVTLAPWAPPFTSFRRLIPGCEPRLMDCSENAGSDRCNAALSVAGAASPRKPKWGRRSGIVRGSESALSAHGPSPCAAMGPIRRSAPISRLCLIFIPGCEPQGNGLSSKNAGSAGSERWHNPSTAYGLAVLSAARAGSEFQTQVQATCDYHPAPDRHPERQQVHTRTAGTNPPSTTSLPISHLAMCPPAIRLGPGRDLR
jgi:hypothetical protein